MQTSLSHGILRWLAGGADDGGRAMPSLMLATMLVLGLTAWLEAERPFVADVVYPRAGCDEPRSIQRCGRAHRIRLCFA